MLSTMKENQYVDYQIYLAAPCSSVSIRYAALGKAEIALWNNEDPVALTTLAATGSMSSWASCEVPLTLDKGKHTLRLEVQSGVANIYRLQVQ